MKYEDFILYFESQGGGGSYHVTVLDSPSGEERGNFDLPFDADEVDRLLWRLEQDDSWPSDSEAFESQDGEGPAERWSPRKAGERLFHALFTGDVLRAYDKSLAKVEEREGHGLRIQLRFDPRDPKTAPLHRLPWELMGTEERPFLALSSRFSVVRYLHTDKKARSLPLKSALRILVVMSSPVVSSSLDLEREREWIARVWNGRKDVEIEVLENARLPTLRAALLKKDYHVLHFMGHGDFDEHSGRGLLYFETEAKAPERLTAEDLVISLRDFDSLSLVFLNACRTASATAGDYIHPFSGVATSLVMSGVPAVLAMQLPISDQAAAVFSGCFYERLAAGDALDAAVAAGRLAVHAHQRESFQWATPVLFMRVHDGWPFEPVTRDSPENPTLLGDYLRWLVAKSSRLALPGVESDRRTLVELEAVYVALRGDRSNPYELAQSRLRLDEEARRLENLPDLEDLAPEQKYKVVWRRINLTVHDPWHSAYEDRDRRQLFHSAEREILNLGEAFRRERRLVILGDPGSGKTTLVRWLTLALAKAYAERPGEQVHVPRHQVDAGCPLGTEEVDLGPARVPILIRVASYAEAWKDHGRNLPLISFLGQHSGPDYGPMTVDGAGNPIDPEALAALLRRLVNEGEAVVFLDGLDEISDPGDRQDVVREIDAFLDGELGRYHGTTPAESGGTQVVVTSRIVGYHMGPLANLASHLTIEPMAPQAVERFCDTYVRAVFRASRPGDPPWTDDDEKEAAREAEGLKKAIADLRGSGADELATNPLLITILALVYRHHHSSFPRQRVKLYEKAVRILLDKWSRRAPRWPFDDEALRRVLEPLAAEIHQRSGIGVLDEPELAQVLGKRLAKDDVAVFLTVLRQEVGLLAERGERVYGFLHLTFQEYLAACALVRDHDRVGGELLERLGDPRWREPILMAFGRLSVELEPAAFEHLLLDLLRQDDSLKSLLPRSALLIVAALPEMESVPARVVGEVAEQLLSTYASPTLRERFPALADSIEQAFLRLCSGGYATSVDHVLRRELLESRPESPDRVPAAASLVAVARRYTHAMAEALAAALPRDSARWGWPVDRALKDLALHEPDLLPYGPGSLRRTLLREPTLAERFLGASDWRRLGRVLYGGVESHLPERISEIKANLAHLREESAAWSTKTDDPHYPEKSSRLDAEIAAAEEALRQAKARGSDFAPERFHRESPALSPLVIEALQEDRPARSLVPALRRLAAEASDPSIRLDAWLALAALNELVAAELRHQPTLAETVTAHLLRIEPSLELAVPAIFGKALTALATLTDCPWEHRIDLIASTIHLARIFGQDLANPIAIESQAPPELKPRLMAEFWLYSFGRDNKDTLYNAAVTLDAMGGVLAPSPRFLAETLAAVPHCAGVQGAQKVWPLEILAPHSREELDVLTAALDAIIRLPDIFDFVRGWALSRLAPLLRKADLLPEAAVIAFGSLSERFGARSETLTELFGSDPHWQRVLGSAYPTLELLEAVKAQEDPYRRFRGYRRLLSYFSDLRNWLLEAAEEPSGESPAEQETSLWNRLTGYFSSYDELLAAQAPDAAQQIANSRHRTWAFEQLAAMDPARRRQWLGRARDAARRIGDPDDRARALARLAVRFPLDEADRDLLGQALAAAAKIGEPRRRAETLAALRPALVGYPDLVERLQDLTDRFQDPWHRIRAQGLHAPFFKHYSSPLASIGVAPDPLELAAILNDLKAEFGLPGEFSDLWPLLATPRRPAALAELEQRGEAHGLQLTREAAAAVDRLLEQGEVELALRLLAQTAQPDPTVSSILEDWLPHDDAAVRAYANLLLAEVQGISEKTIRGVLELLTHTDDRTRYRAALVLHGDRSRSEGPLLVTRVGSRTLRILARQFLDRRDTQPASALMISWTFERIWHNHSRAFTEWVDELRGDPERADEARTILGDMCAMDASLWPAFCRELQDGTPAIQKALLRSLFKLLAWDRVSQEPWERVSSVLAGLSREVAEQESFVLQSPDALVEAARAARAAEQNGESEPLAAAERSYAQRRSHLGQVLSQDPETWQETLSEVGSLRLAGDRFRSRILAASEQVEAEPELFRFLIEWLEQLLRQNIRDAPDSYQLSDLLCIAAAAADRLPNTFYNTALPKEVLHRKLREAAEWHNTFTGRQAALVLLSHLRTVTPHVLTSLRAAVRDVIHVQTVALDCVGRYRDVGEESLTTLFADLYDPSATVAFATGQMLAAIARNIHLEPRLRPLIVEALARAVTDPRSRRGVYRMVEEWRQDEGDVYRIQYEGRLDALLYETMVKLSGAADLRQRSPVATPEDPKDEMS